MSEPALAAPVDLHRHLNAGRDAFDGAWSRPFFEALARLPEGEQRFWGLPFTLAGGAAPAWIVLGASSPESEGRRAITIRLDGPDRPFPASQPPTYLVFVHVCDLSPPELAAPFPAGDAVAEYVLVYDDGSQLRQPIRLRFEINTASPGFGLDAFAARPHVMDAPVDF